MLLFEWIRRASSGFEIFSTIHGCSNPFVLPCLGIVAIGYKREVDSLLALYPQKQVRTPIDVPLQSESCGIIPACLIVCQITDRSGASYVG